MVGFLLVDKPSGCTSHDVVERLRRTLRGVRVGHAGTLDPMATGLLVCGVGQATRLLGRLQLDRKVYEATLRLGIVTDTQDISGTVLDKIDGVRLPQRVVELAAEGFLGVIDQVPPLYSAVKVHGVPMHRRIRRGMAYTPPAARQVEVFRIDVLDVSGPDVRFRVQCSSGTYVRTLCHDWGAKLDVGGCLASLRRLRSGRFDVADAGALDRLQTAAAIQSALRPIDDAFPDLPRYVCSEPEVLAVRQGRLLAADAWPEGTAVGVCDPHGALFALALVIQDNEGLALKASPVLTDILDPACPHPSEK